MSPQPSNSRAAGQVAHPDAAGHADARKQMVARDIAPRGIRDPAVLRAMATVPREEFVPNELRQVAYADRPLPIGEDQTISQPFIVAAMTQLVQPKPEHKILEVGTGSGYQAAVLAEIVKEVYTIEIVPILGQTAEKRLQRLRYDNITVRVGDGYAGWEEHAPFDGILVTAAATHVPQPLVEQLKPGGRIIMPVGPDGGLQYLIVVEKKEDGTVTERREFPVAFVPLTGGHD